MANLIKTYDLMSFGQSFSRLNGQPLDNTSIYYSKDDADAYALTAKAYVGQPVAVIDETAGTTTMYVVGVSGLEQIGSLPDGLSLELYDGKIQLKDFEEASAGAQLRKNADGEIEWFVPSTDTVDGLQSSVSGLQSDMAAAQEDIQALEDLVGTETVEAQIDAKIEELNLAETYEARGAAATAKSEIEAVIGEVAEGKTIAQMIEDAQDAATYDDTELAGRVTTVEEKAESLQTQINTIMNNPDTEGVINSIEEFTQYIADHGEIAEGFRTDIDANKQAIEDHEATAADTYETKTDAAAKLEEAKGYADGLDETMDARVAPMEEKLEGIESGAQVNKVETVSDEFDLTDRHLTLAAVAMDKVTGLPAALEEKVNKVDGSRLMTAAEAEKLEKLVLGEDGSVSVSGTIAAGNVDGLAEWITARAATLEGLSENNLTDALLEKLNSIEEAAQANVINAVSNEFTISADGKVLNINLIEMEKINGLTEALAEVCKLEGIQANGTLLEITDKIVNIKTSDLVKASDEVTVAEDGTLGIGEVNVSKLVQDEGSALILNGGSASN